MTLYLAIAANLIALAVTAFCIVLVYHSIADAYAQIKTTKERLDRHTLRLPRTPK